MTESSMTERLVVKLVLQSHTGLGAVTVVVGPVPAETANKGNKEGFAADSSSFSIPQSFFGGKLRTNFCSSAAQSFKSAYLYLFDKM